MNRREFSKAVAASAALSLSRLAKAASKKRIEPATKPTHALHEFESCNSVSRSTSA